MSEIHSATVKVKNRLGLHARPAMSVVDAASSFASDIFLVKDGQKVDAKSIMHLMMLAAGQGTEMRVEACGADAPGAVAAVVALFEDGFGEN